jgi:hypothetical protein
MKCRGFIGLFFTSLLFIASCGSPVVSSSEPVKRAVTAVRAITYGFDYYRQARGRVIIGESLGWIQETCQHNPNALPFHYNPYNPNLEPDENIEIFVTRCMIVHPYDPLNPLISQTTTLYITDGDDEHLCEETMLGIMEAIYAGGPPRNLFGAVLDPWLIADSWCKCFSEEREELNCGD